MPFPALSLPVAAAIGLPIGLACFAVRETVIRRRTARHAPEPDGAAGMGPIEAASGVSVIAATSAPARLAAKAPATRGATPKASTPAPPAAKAVAARPARGTRTVPLDVRRKQMVALKRGLDAIVAFVDGPARRAGASACADGLLLAVPKAERGHDVAAFLRAVGAKEAPARLQELAEDAGVEIAVAIKALNDAMLRASG
jgi:hypothetical protein